MRIPYYHVDVFTSERFAGNPAGVCLLRNEWLDKRTMQAIAAENNLSETAFVINSDGQYGLRWFTPELEIDLCGHATVAPAHVLFNELESCDGSIQFDTASGRVSVTTNGDLLILDFPSRPPQPCSAPPDIETVMGKEPVQVLRSRDYFLLYESESEIRRLQPDFPAMRNWDSLGVIVTAPGDQADFVSRFFAPSAGVDEDPVTGSAHCSLIPYWARRLGKQRLHARQVSRRGGELYCRDNADRVEIGGRAVTYLRGELEI